MRSPPTVAEAKAIQAANEADDKKDEDGNGIADVKELTPKELLQRKLTVFALAVKDPARLNAAIGGLYTAWIAVQGTLRIEFARTITLGVSMAEMATPTALCRQCDSNLSHPPARPTRLRPFALTCPATPVCTKRAS